MIKTALKAMTFTATVTLKSGKTVKVQERLTAWQHEDNARVLGAICVTPDNGTEMYTK